MLGPILVYLSCSSGHTHFARTNKQYQNSRGLSANTSQDQKLETSNKEEPIVEPDNNGNERMNMMRGKMMKSRKRQELLETLRKG